jgi:hypothetical protein
VSLTEFKCLFVLTEFKMMTTACFSGDDTLIICMDQGLGEAVAYGTVDGNNRGDPSRASMANSTNLYVCGVLSIQRWNRG